MINVLFSNSPSCLG